MNWVRRLLVVEAKGPLLFAENPGGGNVIRSLPYIPGGSIRGALAQRYLAGGGMPSDPLFCRLFDDGDCFFGNLTIFRGPARPFVLPVTASTCKRHPGFLADGPEAHGARDVLADLWRAARGAAGAPRVCAKDGCSAPWDRLYGFARWIPRSQCYERVFIRGYRRGHTGIAAAFQSAQAGALFFHEVLAEGSQFAGLIRCAPDLFDSLRDLLGDNIALGAATSRGLGGCSVVEWRDPEEPEPIADRVAAWARVAEDNGGAPFSSVALTCASDVLLRDGAGRSVTTGIAAALRAAAASVASEESDALAGWDVALAQSRTRLVAGWQASWGLPKPQAWAIAAGSTYVLRAPAPLPSPDQASVFRALAAVERVGIGERREEGFGEIRVGDPFHVRRSASPDGRL